MDYALTLDGVTKRFGSFTAVDDLSLRIPRGCIYGFLGQNGAGKTTTIRMVMSIFHPDRGTISVLGHPDASEVKDRLGYLPEEKGLYKKMKTGEIIAYFGKLKGLDPATANRRAKELLTRYGLGDWIDKKCEAMSKGMGQKVQVLGTIIHESELVILDEPFSGLDPVNRDMMRDLILDMKRSGRTVIFSTHEMERAEQLCDYVMMIHKARLQFAGPLAEVRQGRDFGIQLDYDGDGAALRSLPGVSRVNDSGKFAELFLAPNADPQAVLAALVGKVRIRRFDVREPSLHEVFVRTVEQANQKLEAAAAAGGR
ncbi:MAG: ATP-binding cassette domain-containing protein [Planctomycetes bacterium]|nr:ATP-binding cassette domain-containing protein [Planctomycetota bacterium]